MFELLVVSVHHLVNKYIFEITKTLCLFSFYIIVLTFFVSRKKKRIFFKQERTVVLTDLLQPLKRGDGQLFIHVFVSPAKGKMQK